MNDRIYPRGKLRRATESDVENSTHKNLYVSVYKIGMRRKYVDERGQIFVRCFGEWWKFPEDVEF
jgi:hypothetical protein